MSGDLHSWDGVWRAHFWCGGTREVGFEAYPVVEPVFAASLQLWASWGWCINLKPFSCGTREVGSEVRNGSNPHIMGLYAELTLRDLGRRSGI